MGTRDAEIWNAAIRAAAQVARQEWDEKPIVAPLTNAAYDEAARTIESGILELLIESGRPSQAAELPVNEWVRASMPFDGGG